MLTRAARQQRIIRRVPAGESPEVVSVSPLTGTTLGGTTLTIELDAYAGTLGAVSRELGGQPLDDFTVVNGTRVTTITHAHIAGHAELRVINQWGRSLPLLGFTYVAPTPGGDLETEGGGTLTDEDGDVLETE